MEHGKRWGKVSKYFEDRAFGYIREHANSSPSGRATEQFFHLNNVEGRIILKVNDQVSFSVVPSSKTGKDEAVNVRLFMRLTADDAVNADGQIWDQEQNLLLDGGVK